MNRTSFRLAVAFGVVVALAVGGCDDDAKSTQGGASASAQAGKRPKIVAAASHHDFGKVKQGAEVVHVFKVRNQGGAPLLIQKAKGS